MPPRQNQFPRPFHDMTRLDDSRASSTAPSSAADYTPHAHRCSIDVANAEQSLKDIEALLKEGRKELEILLEEGGDRVAIVDEYQSLRHRIVESVGRLRVFVRGFIGPGGGGGGSSRGTPRSNR